MFLLFMKIDTPTKDANMYSLRSWEPFASSKGRAPRYLWAHLVQRNTVAVILISYALLNFI